MENDIGLADLIQSRAEGVHQFMGQVGYEPHRVGENGGTAIGQAKLTKRRVERGEKHRFRQNLSPGQAIEQRRLASVRVADQGDDRIGRAFPPLPLKATCPAHVGQIGLELDNPIQQQTPVRLDLGLAGTAEKTEATPLPFEVGPGAHQP